ncbi:MAG TPA: hypothetical protein VF526_13315 [Solirubrobacteraceae bacterium]|jgi:uncharacterized membrane protein YdfJ with MMPL/SSD domain
MTSGALPLVGWGLALLAIALLGATVFDLGTLSTLLLAGGGAGSIGVGIAQAIAKRRRPRRAGEPEMLLRSSVATLVLTAGLTLAFVGAVVVGPALLWPGIGFVVVGAGGLARELRATRRGLADARERSGA